VSIDTGRPEPKDDAVHRRVVAVHAGHCDRRIDACPGHCAGGGRPSHSMERRRDGFMVRSHVDAQMAA